MCSIRKDISIGYDHEYVNINNFDLSHLRVNPRFEKSLKNTFIAWFSLITYSKHCKLESFFDKFFMKPRPSKIY